MAIVANVKIFFITIPRANAPWVASNNRTNLGMHLESNAPRSPPTHYVKALYTSEAPPTTMSIQDQTSATQRPSSGRSLLVSVSWWRSAMAFT